MAISPSHYWFNRVGAHPAMAQIDYKDLGGAYDGHALIDQVDAAHQANEVPEHLLECQRREWLGLFAWCSNRC